MKKYLFLAALASMPFLCFSQSFHIQMKGGTLVPVGQPTPRFQPNADDQEAGRMYRLVQFHHIPSKAQLKVLETEGVRLLQYIPNNAYIASLPLLHQPDAYAPLLRSITIVAPHYKKDAHLLSNKIPRWAQRGAGKIEVLITFADDISDAQMRELLPAGMHEEVIFIEHSNSFRIITTLSALEPLLQKPYILFAECFDNDPQPEEIRTRSNHRSSVIDQRGVPGSLQLRGEGIAVALNDDGIIGPHIDYKGRLAAQYISFNNGNHGDHCGGIIMAAGNLDPKGEGMASGADIHVYGVSGAFASQYQAFDSLYNHYVSKNIRIVSTSYGQGVNQGYTNMARNLDIQMLNMPKAMHVFSSGNSGSNWYTITGGHKAAKNVTTVGNVTYTDNIAGSSSRGPAQDGRIKPEICAVGTAVYSTVNTNTYISQTGTSMACPGIAGVYAQLMEGYKLLKTGDEADAALLKGLLMNTADDLGNAGPDFYYGYGRVNAARAYQVMQAEQYIIDSVSNGDSLLFPVDVPAGVSELRVMLNYADKEASPAAARDLVNDLNMTVTTPNNITYLPWVLNTTSTATLSNPAVRTTDSLNNMEQVTISNPATGIHAVKIKGKTVPFGPQKFFINYEFVYSTPKLVYPIGREGFVPGVVETIRWDAYGNSGTFSIDYSIDNGANWISIASNVPSAQRYYDWTVPNAVTAQAKVRVTRNNASSISPNSFTIIDRPTGIAVDWVCGDSMKVSYNQVNGATKYIVTVLGDKYMDSAGVSTTTSCIARKPGINAGGWFSVQAVIDTGIGRRANAMTFQSAPFNCAVVVDMEMSGIISPTQNDVLDCDSNSFSIPVTVTVKNNTPSAQSNIQLGFTVNGMNPVVESMTGNVAANSTANYTFTANAVLTHGTNSVEAFLIHPNDVFSANDTTVISKRTLQLPAVNPSMNSIAVNFDNLPNCDTAANCGTTECDLGTSWINLRNGFDDGMDWRVHDGPTPSRSAGASTGPASGTGNYIYIEANSCANATATLMGPCITLDPGSDMLLSYELHMYGADAGGLYVDIFDGNAWALNVQQTTGNQGDQWTTKTLGLNAYAGKTINIRFRGTTLNGALGDIAIDNIGVAAKPQGITDANNWQQQITVFPNPADNMAAITLPSNIQAQQLQVLDASGKIVLQQKVGAQHKILQIPMTQWAAGVYMIKLTTEKGVWTQQLIRK